MLAALAAAHRAGLVHRDIKPENILIADDGAVKVADFGLARAIETDGHATATGIMMGTVAYCSPEQISRGRTDARSDVYATGIVLYELLTGTPPYVGESAVNVAFQHVHNRVPAPSARVRGIDPRLDELVLRATDSDPAGRPIDAGAFLAEMNDVRTDLDLPVVVLAGPRATGQGRANGGRRARRHRERRSTQNLGAPRPTTIRPAGAAHRRPADGDAATRWPSTRARSTTSSPTRGRRRRSSSRRRSSASRAAHRAAGAGAGALIGFFVVLLLGGAVGYGSWWYASGPLRPGAGADRAEPGRGDQRAEEGRLRARRARPRPSSATPSRKDLVISTAAGAPARGCRTATRSRWSSPRARRWSRSRPSPSAARTDEARALLGGVPITVDAVDHQPAQRHGRRPARCSAPIPAGGTSVGRGTQVQLIVSSGPPILTVPDETGKAQQAATDDLKAARLRGRR